VAKVLLLQGANLTFLGRREPEIYGTTTPAELDAMLQHHAQEHAHELGIFYTNIEGEAINRIYQAKDEGFEGLVMNPAGFTYGGLPCGTASRGRRCRTWRCISAASPSATSTASFPMWRKGSSPVSECTLTFSASMQCWKYSGHMRAAGTE
jgi:Dehydroquinase class II